MSEPAFRRRVRVEVGLPGETGVAFEGLRVSFKVDKVAGSEPDTAEIQIYNLSQTSRSKFEQPGAVVRLFAGYGSAEPPLIFTGDIEEASTQWAPPDCATVIKAADGAAAMREGRLVETFRGPLRAAVLFERLADRLGLPITYMPTDLPAVEYQSSYSVHGPIRRAMDDVAATLGCTWSVQDGAVVLVARGAVATTMGPLLDESTGLVGSPEKAADGSVKVRSLLNARLVPHARFELRSRDLGGYYRATKVSLVGDSGWDDAFYSEAEAQPFEVGP